MSPFLLVSSAERPAVFVGLGYEERVAFIADRDGGTYHYWQFEEGDHGQGPFHDVGDASSSPVLTSNLARLTVGRMYCGSRGEPVMMGVVHGNRSTLTTPGWIGDTGAGSMPQFGAPGAIMCLMRQGFAIEKGVMWARVANTGATQEYEAAIEILSTGVLRLRIETPAGNVTVTTDAAVWPSAERNNWKSVAIVQPDDGGGIDIYVNGSAVAVTRAYTGTAGVASWIDDMLAYGSRDTAQDRFRLLDRGQTESNLDAYNHVGVGGFAIFNGATLTSGDVSDLHDDMNLDGTPVDIFDVVNKICEDNGDDWPVFWAFAGLHMGLSSDTGHTGLALNRPAYEDDAYKAQAIQLDAGNTDARSARLRELMTGFSPSSTFDSIQANSANGNPTWQNWNFTGGTIVVVGRFDAAEAGVNKTMFYWGRTPLGNARQSYLELRADNNENLTVNFVERGQTTSAPRSRDYRFLSGGFSAGDLMALVITKEPGSDDPRMWLNGTELTNAAVGGSGAFYDDSTFYDADTWFQDVKTAVDAQGGAQMLQFGSGSSSASSTGGWDEGKLEHVIVDDATWTPAQVTEFFDALDDAAAYKPPGDEITVTVGTTGSPTTLESGFESGSHGSVAGTLSFGGGTIRELQWRDNGGNSQFVFDCDNILTQDAFRVIAILTPHGYYRYHTNEATFTASGGRSRWVWDANNDWWQDYSGGETTYAYLDT